MLPPPGSAFMLGQVNFITKGYIMLLASLVVLITGGVGIWFLIRPELKRLKNTHSGTSHYKNYVIDKTGTLVYTNDRIDVKV